MLTLFTVSSSPATNKHTYSVLCLRSLPLLRLLSLLDDLLELELPDLEELEPELELELPDEEDLEPLRDADDDLKL